MRTLVYAAICFFLSGAVPAFAGQFRAAGANGVPDQYMVVLAEGAARKAPWPDELPDLDLPPVAAVAQTLARRHGGAVIRVWENALTGFLVRMPAGRAQALARDPRVAFVEQDSMYLEPEWSSPVADCGAGTSGVLNNLRPLPTSSSSPQTITCDDPDPSHDTTGAGQTPRCIDNWGLDRIDQRGAARDARYYFDRTGSQYPWTVTVYVVDGGIYAGHREFLNDAGQSRVAPGYDATGGPTYACGLGSNTEDTTPHGHGTHVAGIIGGRTYGVAKNVRIVPVKIGCPDVAYHSWLVSGLDWIAGTSTIPSVVNWSGGNAVDWMSDPTIITAARGVVNHGYLLVQSAGNQSQAYAPMHPELVKDACNYSLGATVAGAMIVGGSDERDGRWTREASDPLFQSYADVGDFGSNVGSCIDIWAPAAHVVSASKWGPWAYCRLSGTSMAAPHVTGAAALYLEAHPLASVNEVTQALINNATWGALDTNPSSWNRIGTGSPNVLLYSRVP